MRTGFRTLKRAAPAIFGLYLLSVAAAASAETSFESAIQASQPLAYYVLGSPRTASLVGTSRYRINGGVQMLPNGGPRSSSQSPFAAFDGKNGWIVTTLSGGVRGDASMMAWVNLAAAPSSDGRILYIMGESQYGNDLDVQFETDNSLRFYTAAGGNLKFQPPREGLVGAWHMVVVTFDARLSRAIYWDGQRVAHDTGGGEPNKSGFFSIGASTVFGGRYFDGGIADVALWNRALTPAEIAKFYTVGVAPASPSR